MSEMIQSRSQILRLSGVSELLKGKEAGTVYEKIVIIIASVADTIDARAMIDACVLEGGMSHKREASFRQENKLWVTPLMREEHTCEPEKVLSIIAAFAVSEMKRYLAMNSSDFLVLPDEEQSYARSLRGLTSYLLESIFQSQISSDIGDGLNLRALDNLRKDVTEAERKSGTENPQQVDLRRVLLEVVDNDQDTFERIVQITGLDPAHMISLITNKAVPDRISNAIQRFLEIWNNREELDQMVIEVYSKGLRSLLNVGADVDFLLELQRLPTGEQLERAAESIVQKAKIFFDAVLPHFCGVTPDDLRGRGLSRFGMMQLGHRYAAQQSGVNVPDWCEYSHPIDTVEQVEAKVLESIALVQSVIPITKEVGARIHINMGLNLYAAARPVNIWFYRCDDEGNKEMINYTRQDPANESVGVLASMYAHEVAGHGVQAYILECMQKSKAADYKDTVFSSPQLEFFAEVIEDGLGAICPQSVGVPQIQALDGDVEFSAKFLTRIFVDPRQLPFGLSNVKILKLIEEALLQHEGILDVSSIIRQGKEIIHSGYTRMFGGLGMVFPGRSLYSELSRLGDGLCYLSLQRSSVIDVVSDRSKQENVGDKSKEVNWKKLALDVLRVRFGEEWVRNHEALSVFYSLMVYAVENRDMNDWIQYLQECTAEQASRLLKSKAGITIADQGTN